MQANGKVDEESRDHSDELLLVATAAANAAAEVVRSAAAGASSLLWELKGVSDFVTEVDRTAELRMSEVIRSAVPDASVMGEELSPDSLIRARGTTFVADPIDGTTNFLHGYPQYSVSIGVLVDSSLVAGVVLNVVSGELFTATHRGGAYRNGDRIAVSSIDSPSRALIGTGFPFKRQDLLDDYSRQFIEISRQTAGIRRAGSAALDLADVACGRFDGFWELVLSPWDVAAGILLIQEAGGVVTDMQGQSKTVSHGPVVAGNPSIQPWLLKILAKRAH